MSRTVTVTLDADVGPYIAGLGRAAAATEALDRKIDGLDRSTAKLGPDTSKAAAAMSTLTASVGSLGTGLSDVDRRSATMTVLERRITDVRTEVKRLGDEFVRTGDVDVFSRLTHSQGALRGLEDMKSKLKKAVGDGLDEGVSSSGPKAASSFAQLFQGGIIKALANPAIAAAAAVVGIPLVAMLASAVGAAVTGAVALGVVGAGIAGAAMADPKRVGAAWEAEIARLKADFLSASSSFVGPTIDAIHQIGTAVHNLDLAGIFQKASAFVGPLADGISRMVPALGRAIEAFIDGAGPIIDELAAKLPQLGQALETFAKDITGDSKDAADALGSLIDLIDGVIIGTGKFIHGAEEVWGAIRKTNDGIDDFMHHLRETNGLFYALLTPTLAITDAWRAALNQGSQNFEQFGTDAGNAAAKVAGIGSAAEGAAEVVGSAADAMKDKWKGLDADIGAIGDAFAHVGQTVESAFTNKLLDQMFAFDDATIAFETSLSKLDDTAKKNGTSLDVLNEKTGKYNDKALANQRVLIDAAKANAQVYEQTLLATGSTEQATAAYDKGYESLRRQAVAAGYNAKAVDGLIGKYKGIPTSVSTLIATVGLTNALNRLSDLYIKIFNIPDGHFNIYGAYIGPHVGSMGGKEGPGKYALGGIRHAATGLIVGPSDPGTMIGEPQTGGEALIPLRGIPQMRAQMLMQTAGNGYGLDVVPRGGNGGSAGTAKMVVELRVTGRGELATVLQGMVRKGSLQLVPQST